MVPRRTHRALRPDEVHNPVEEKKRSLFDSLIEKKWGTAIGVPTELPRGGLDDWE